MNRTENEYNAPIDTIERLNENSSKLENRNTKDYRELNLLADLVVDDEEIYYPI